MMSLAIAALGASPERLLGDLNLMGLLFESLVVRDLRVLAQPLEGRVLHYRDSYGVEVDCGNWIWLHALRWNCSDSSWSA